MLSELGEGESVLDDFVLWRRIVKGLIDFRRLADNETDLVLAILIFEDIVVAGILGFAAAGGRVTNFTSGQTVTFPMFIYGSYRVGVPVQVNVIGTIIFMTAVGAVVLSTLLQRRDRGT